MNTLIKNWLIASLYLYLFTILGHFQLPITDTDLAYVMSPIFLVIFVLAFCIAVLLQLWRSLLPHLNKYYGYCMLGLFTLFLLGWNLLSPYLEAPYHLSILLIFLGLQLTQYRLYNEPLEKKRPKVQETKKISKLSIFITLFISLGILYTTHTNKAQQTAIEYEEIYPTQEELLEMFPAEAVDVNIFSNENNRSVNAYYIFPSFYIQRIDSALSIKNVTTTFDNYSYYVYLERTVENDYTKLKTSIDQLKLYYKTTESYSDETGQLVDYVTGTHTTVFAIYETDKIKLYLDVNLVENTIVDERKIRNDIEKFINHIQNFSHE